MTAGPREAACGHCKQLGLAGTDLLEWGRQTHPAALQNVCKIFAALSINPGSEKHELVHKQPRKWQSDLKNMSDLKNISDLKNG